MITNSISVKVSAHKSGFRALTAVIAVLFFCSVTFTAFATTNNSGSKEKSKFTISGIFGSMRALADETFKVNINLGGKDMGEIYSGGTVADAIESAGIKLNGNDIVFPSLDTEINGLTDIRIFRVSYKTVSEIQTVAYDTVEIPDEDMYVGEEKIVTKGVNGEKKVFRTVKCIDGAENETLYSKEKVISEPVDEVKRVGTKQAATLGAFKNTTAPISDLKVPSDLKLDENGIPVDYAYCVSGKATAYTGDPATASGRTPMPGHIAVDPKEYPYGTELYVVSEDGSYVYGYCIAADTGGFVKMGNTDIDLYMDNEDMCCDWGNRNVKIYVLN